MILPLVAVLSTFIVFTLKFWMPGVSKKVKKVRPDSESNIQRYPETTPEFLPEKTLDFLNDLNKAIITVNGFIISILGGFLISSGLNNFYFFLGFETIMSSLISSLAAYPSFISSENRDSQIRNSQVTASQYIHEGLKHTFK